LNIEEIKKIIDLMKSSDLSEFEIEEDSFKLRISRRKEDQTNILTTGLSPPFAAPHHASPLPVPQETTDGKISSVSESEPTGDFITSPMVGTFYLAPSPESSPFVEKGTEVNNESVVCIIEAMKVMNEIQAEMSGEILEVLIENGQSVEFGQPLFKIRKS
tara:strand:+ start:4494 stop:4973 length:480 start_codon:yes stop_codon:yes gene_type:complete